MGGQSVIHKVKKNVQHVVEVDVPEVDEGDRVLLTINGLSFQMTVADYQQFVNTQLAAWKTIEATPAP